MVVGYIYVYSTYSVTCIWELIKYILVYQYCDKKAGARNWIHLAGRFVCCVFFVWIACHVRLSSEAHNLTYWFDYTDTNLGKCDDSICGFIILHKQTRLCCSLCRRWEDDDMSNWLTGGGWLYTQQYGIYLHKIWVNPRAVSSLPYFFIIPTNLSLVRFIFCEFVRWHFVCHWMIDPALCQEHEGIAIHMWRWINDK